MDDEAPEPIVFELPSGKVTVREEDLDTIRQAVIDHLKSSHEPLRDTFAAELAGALTWIDDDGVGRVNQWLLERRGDHLALVRHPPRSPAMIFFVADLAKEANPSWKVTSFRQERVNGR